MNGETPPPLIEGVSSPSPPPIIATRVWLPRPFSHRATMILAVLALALFFFRNWAYVSGSRLDFFWYPEVTASWVLHQDMLLHEGAENLNGNPKLFLRLIGLGTDKIPEECELMLRDMIAHAGASQGAQPSVDELRAHLTVLLAETGSLSNAMKELALLSKSDEAVRFERMFRSIYATNSSGLTLTASNVGKTELLSGWAHWRFTARELKNSDNAERREEHERSIRWGADQVLWRLIIVFAAAWLMQMVGLVCLARFAFGKAPRIFVEPAASDQAWSAAESWGLFVRGFLFGLIAEQLLVRLPFVGYAAWLAHALVFSLPVIALLGWRHWLRDPASFGRFFGIPKTAVSCANLLGASLALFAICWISVLWLPALLEALGIKSNWADGVDDVLLTWPWSARIVHLADGIVFGPLMEEIVFRGLLFGALRTRLSPLPAAALSALVFGGIHFYSLPGFMGVTLFGFWCALAREKTGSLLPGLAAHVMTNFFIFGGQALLSL